jgi:hypothetical protein
MLESSKLTKKKTQVRDPPVKPYTLNLKVANSTADKKKGDKKKVCVEGGGWEGMGRGGRDEEGVR